MLNMCECETVFCIVCHSEYCAEHDAHVCLPDLVVVVEEEVKVE